MQMMLTRLNFVLLLTTMILKSMDYFTKTVVPWFQQNEYDILVMSFDRLGYAKLNEYMQTLALEQ